MEKKPGKNIQVAWHDKWLVREDSYIYVNRINGYRFYSVTELRVTGQFRLNWAL